MKMIINIFKTIYLIFLSLMRIEPSWRQERYSPFFPLTSNAKDEKHKIPGHHDEEQRVGSCHLNQVKSNCPGITQPVTNSESNSQSQKA